MILKIRWRVRIRVFFGKGRRSNRGPRVQTGRCPRPARSGCREHPDQRRWITRQVVYRQAEGAGRAAERIWAPSGFGRREEKGTGVI
jgi:hypothetical protein